KCHMCFSLATRVLCSCPIKLNPPMVVVKYGDPISINCSTSETHFEGMGWEAIKAGKSVQETSHLNWALTNVTDWDINPSCFINLKNSTLGQCDRIPKIVVYTFPRNIDINSVTNGVMKEGETHNLTCHIQHVAPVQNLTIRWYRGDTPVHIDTFNNQDRKPQNQTSVYTFTPTKDDNRIKFRCEAHMDLGPEGPELNVSSPEYHITVHCEYAMNILLYQGKLLLPVFFFFYSLAAGQKLQLQCIVTEVAPARNVVVQWYHGNDTFEPTTTGWKCPITLISTITITLDRNHNGVEFKCKAQMDVGPRLPVEMISHPLNITVYYKPVINERKLPKVFPVFNGYPEELVCEADGQPPPEIQWSSDKGNHVPGATILVTKAGFYNCTATNEVDSVFHEIEVILKEDYLPLIAGFVAITVIAISVVFCFIYSIYYKNTKMRRYSLKNPKLSTQNGNVAHNGWDLQFPMTKLS
uniref:Ig-like domain-containing protein n=1 Tax=Echeneis naucrates TaxID=173247 RepID=A0A665UHI0_ECHNA